MKPSEMSDEQLVKAVLIEVMNRPELSNDEYVAGKSGFYITTYGRVFILCPEKEEFYPLHRPDHWWMVVLRMRELGWFMKHEVWPDTYEVSFVRSPVSTRNFKSWVRRQFIGRAVCESALVAVRGKEGG